MRGPLLISLVAVLSVSPALAVPTSPSDHGAFDTGASPPEASGLVTHVDLGNYLSGYLTQAQASQTYLPLAGGAITGPISGGYYIPQCYTVAALKELPTPSSAAYACYLDSNNSNQPNIAVYALGAWRYLTLGSAL